MIAGMFTLFFAVGATYDFKDALRIYNGFDADSEKYPYVVVIKPEIDPKYFVQRMCTGSLIDPKWVLTAAHCLTDTAKYIQYGDMSQPLNYTDTKSKVVKMIKHPRVFPASYTNNIGLILVEKVTMSKYGSVSAVDYFSLIGLPVEYAGFGMSYYPKRKVRDKLKQIMTDVMRPLQIGEAVVKTCGEPFSRNFICLSSKCSRTQLIMPGDSGLPLLCGQKIIGIACTFMVDQNEQIFTPISPYLTWIQKVVESDE